MLGIVGAVARTPALREISWRSEMKRRYVFTVFASLFLLPLHCSCIGSVAISFLNYHHSLAKLRSTEDLDPRMSFTTFAQRAGLLAPTPPPDAKEQ